MRKKKIKDKSLKQARSALMKWIIERIDDNTKLTSGQLRAYKPPYLSQARRFLTYNIPKEVFFKLS